MRDEYVALFKRRLVEFVPGEQDEKIATVARRIERGCFNKTISDCTREFIPRVETEPRYVARYSAECYRVIECIDAGVARKLMTEELDSRVVSEKSTIELRPDATQSVRDDIEHRRNQQVSEKYAKEKCRRCHAARVVYVLAHTRAADEIASFHYKCRECGHTWGL